MDSKVGANLYPPSSVEEKTSAKSVFISNICIVSFEEKNVSAVGSKATTLVDFIIAFWEAATSWNPAVVFSIRGTDVSPYIRQF